MDIVAEITEEKFHMIAKSYYLNKNWDKLIAILAIAALILDLTTPLPTYHRTDIVSMHFRYFNAILTILMIFFFVLPYLVFYVEMRLFLKKKDLITGMYNYHMDAEGIHVRVNDLDRSYLWDMVSKVYTASGFVIMKINTGELLILPILISDDEDNQGFLQFARANTPHAKWKSLKK
ncbi:MAG TPA: hypothetical protein VK671_12810 [Mucilaginibacter sp.]|nr:hypothetical protein [Mucilaginibacter sp.]